jgi:hypothetical protein
MPEPLDGQTHYIHPTLREPTSAFYSCIPTRMHGPTCIFWANLRPFSLERAPRQLEGIADKVHVYEQLCTFSIIIMVFQLIQARACARPYISHMQAPSSHTPRAEQPQKLNFHPRMGVISRTAHSALEDLFFFFTLLMWVDEGTL